MTFLRPAPTNAPRPTALHFDVVSRGVRGAIIPIAAWCAARIQVNEEAMVFAVATSIVRGGLDGFRSGCALREHFNWPVDYTLTRILHEITERLPSALKVETAEWVIRTGLRFPGAVGDKIEFIDESERRFAGEIMALEKSFAGAIVRLDKDDALARAFAEQVVANVTQGLYEEITPVLGARYDDAVALGAAWEASRPKVVKPTLTVTDLDDEDLEDEALEEEAFQAFGFLPEWDGYEILVDEDDLPPSAA